MRSEVLSLGTMYIDINLTHFPFNRGLLPETEIVGRDYEMTLGGSALNFARMCTTLGLETVFIGKTGVDPLGEMLGKLAQESGIISAFIRDPNVSTNLGINFINPEGQRIMAVGGTANQSLSFEEVERMVNEHIAQAKYFYLGGCFKLKSFVTGLSSLAEEAKRHNVKVVLDHGRIPNGASQEEVRSIRGLLPSVDFYFPSRNEFLAVWDVEEIEEGFKKIRAESEATVVVKDGINGAVGFNGKETFRVPVSPVQVVNTVGAGDSFNAGFIRADRDGLLSFRDCVRFACTTAAVKISRPGLPTMESVMALLSTASESSLNPGHNQ